MSVRAQGLGFRGPKGDAGDAGPIGLTGPQGPKGDTGATGPQGPQGVKGDTGATGAQGAQGVKGDTGATGATGPAGATGPIGATGATGATGAAGTNATILVGTVTLSESSLITLALAVRRVTVALTGTVTTGSYAAIPTAAPPSGYSIQDAYCSTAGQITVGILVPTLSVASSYSISVRIFRVN